jgi:serine/threonine protein kinase
MAESLIGRVIGKYKVTERIGSDGLLEVYRGIQVGLDREVAIRVLPPALASDREAVMRFRRESQATARLSHPNIITIYDSGEEVDHHYCVMECLNSNSLEDILAEQAPLPVPRVLKIGHDILKALAYIHGRDVIHCDLRPANIHFDQRNNAIVTHFGYMWDCGLMAEPVGEAFRGTPPYASPEQILGLELDHRSDLYQVGLIMHESLTGRLPVDGAPTRRDSGTEVPATSIADPREMNPEIPAELSSFLTKVLQQAPSDRLQSARDMLSALKRIELKEKSRRGGASQATAAQAAPSATAPENESFEPAPFSSANAPGSSVLVAKKPALMVNFLVFILGGVMALWVARLLWHPPQTKVTEESWDVQVHQATITWKTDRNCYAALEYWPAAHDETRIRTRRGTDPNVQHRQELTDLLPDTLYRVRFLFSASGAADAVETASEIFEFRSRPEIELTNLFAAPESRKVVITFETNIPTDATVRYGITTQYGSGAASAEQRTRSHIVLLDGLTPSTTYHYQILLSDPAAPGQSRPGTDSTFQTLAKDPPPQTPNAPALSQLTRDYIDKLGRMTPDEREKLRASILKFSGNRPFSSEQKKPLLASYTSPNREDEFNDRLQAANSWINRLRTKKLDVAPLETEARQVQTLYQTNRVKAASRLDTLLRQLNRLDKD